MVTDIQNLKVKLKELKSMVAAMTAELPEATIETTGSESRALTPERVSGVASLKKQLKRPKYKLAMRENNRSETPVAALAVETPCSTSTASRRVTDNKEINLFTGLHKIGILSHASTLRTKEEN